jgi:hypothetical protein
MTVEFMNCFMRTFPVLKAIDETESPRNETSPGDHRREIVQAAFIRPRHNNCPLIMTLTPINRGPVGKPS